MVVKSKPGAGGLVGINYIYNNAKPDGLSTCLVDYGGQLLGAWLFKRPGVKFDIEKFTWLSVLAPDPYTFVVGVKTPYKTIDDLKGAKGFKFGTVSHSGSDAVACALLAEAFNMKDARIIPGYRGSSPVGVAMGRGEVDGASFNNAGSAAFVTKGFARPQLVTLWPKRVKELPDVPTLEEVVDLSPDAKTLLKVFYALVSAKAVFGPPGIPDEKVQFMRDAIDKITKMKAFKRQLQLRYVIWLEPTRGEDVVNEINNLLAIPEQDVATVERILKKYVK
jgi:tripartite-type tricarboxylate transporter receptor subunit TctC